MSDTSLDDFLGARPTSRLGGALSLLLLVAATLAAAALLVRFLGGNDGPYYTAAPSRGAFTPIFTTRGVLHGQNGITVSAGQEGLIGAVPDLGSGTVRQGQVLAVFDPAPIAQAILSDRAADIEAEAALGRAEVAATQMSVRLERYENVWRRSNKRVPSLNEMEGARADAARTAFDLDAAQAARDQARRQLATDRARRASASVLAPVSGFVTARWVRPGQYVRLDQPLFTIETSLGSLQVVVPADFAGGSSLRLRAKASVLVDGLADRARPATLTALSPAVAGTTGPQAVFTLDQPDSEARPGMLATIEAQLPRREDALLVPNAALAFVPGGRAASPCHCLYVLSREGTPRRVAIVAGASDGSHTEVLSREIQPDTKIIVGWRGATAARP